MIDCDIHVQITHQEEILKFIDAPERDWYRNQAYMLGLPAYPWSNPSNWFRGDLAVDESGMPGGNAQVVATEALDGQGADIGILTADDALSVGLMENTYRAAALARAHNDWQSEDWFPHDDRFRGSIIVPSQDTVAAVAEIERCAGDRRFVQVLLAGGSERPYGDPRYLPILEAAAANGLAVAIHSGMEGMGLAHQPTGAGAPTFYIEWHTIGSACSIMAHLMSLLTHGTFRRVPDLKVLLIEGGIAWLPGMLWRNDTNWRGLRDDTPWVDRLPSEIMQESIRFATQPLEHTNGNDELLMQMLAAVGAPDILCYASDYPHWDGDEPSYFERRLPESWRQGVMHDNAVKFYGNRLNLPVAK
jgi:predicted TIM-barrel fold metal-dependent hydrolase